MLEYTAFQSTSIHLRFETEFHLYRKLLEAQGGIEPPNKRFTALSLCLTQTQLALPGRSAYGHRAILRINHLDRTGAGDTCG
jgi:hypothetical protein